MLLHRKLPLAFALLGLVLAAPRAEAALILDTFDFPASGSSCTGISNCMDIKTNIGFFSATRTLETSEATASINDDAPDAFFYQDTDGTHSFSITYALSGKDITAGDATGNVTIGVLSASMITALKVTITDSMMNSHFETVDPTSMSAPFDILIPFSAYAMAGVNLTDIGTIKLEVVGQQGSLALDYVLTPEPSTAGMLLLGLLGLAHAGRGRKAAA